MIMKGYWKIWVGVECILNVVKNLSNLPYKDNLYRCFDFVVFVTPLNMTEQENYVILSVVSVTNGVEISMWFNLIHKDHFNRFFDYANAPLRMTSIIYLFSTPTIKFVCSTFAKHCKTALVSIVNIVALSIINIAVVNFAR